MSTEPAPLVRVDHLGPQAVIDLKDTALTAALRRLLDETQDARNDGDPWEDGVAAFTNRI